MRDLVLIAATFAASLASVVRPVFGVFAFAFFGFFVPHNFVWSFAKTFPMSQMIAIATIVGTVISSNRKSFPLQREAVVLLALWAIFGFSTLFALRQPQAAQELERMSKILLMVGLTMVFVDTEEKLLWLIRIIGLSLGCYGLKCGIFAIATAGGEVVYGPENSFLEANNAIGLALAMNVPMLMFLLKREKAKWLRWLIKAMVVFSYPAVICTFSRGAWLGLGMVTALAFLKSKYKFVTIAAAGLLMMILHTAAPQLLSPRITNRYDSLVNYEDDSSAQSRFWNWEFCRRVGFARPLTGGGFNYYSQDAYSVYYPEFQQRWPGKLWSCHSTWLSVFGEHGVPGFILWFGLVIACFKSLRRLRFYGETYPEWSFLLSYAEMLQASIVAYLVIGTFLDAAYFDLFYYLVAVIVVLKQIIALELKPQKNETTRIRAHLPGELQTQWANRFGSRSTT